MKSHSRRNRILGVLIIAIVVFTAVISVTGIGSFKGLKKEMKYGLDINGGVYVLLQANTKEKGQDRTALMEQTKSVLENRVNAMGISEATVSVEGSDKIRVEMPGVSNANQAIKQIGKTAQLRFLLADGTLVMQGNEVKNAGFSTDSDHGGYKITMDFTSKGTDDFAKGTERAASGAVNPVLRDSDGNLVPATSVVIMLDDEIISAPNVDQKIDSRSCEIYKPGGFSKEEASSTAALIKGGALPASLTEVNSSVETATIGADALNKSIKAGGIGLLLVFAIMIIVYGAMGVAADIALALYVEIVLWVIAAFGAVLTLPGIAGIILGIGMAVDSNVIIFTRIREEIAKGKSVRVSVDSGFHSAFATVIDAQTTTLIAAFVLYLIGATSVKGFALTLMIGTVASIFTAVFVTQVFINIMAESKTLSKLKFFGFKEDGTKKVKFEPHFRFIKNRKIFYCISAAVIICGMVFAGVRGFNYGIDFTGGTMIQMDMGQKVNINEVKDTISKYDLDPTIVYAGKGNKQIVIKTIKALKTSERTQVVKTISDKYDLGSDAVLSSEEFGPTVGKQLRHNAIESVLIATLCMLVYIRFRFKNWEYGVAAVAGLAHDVLVTLSLYAIFGFTINNPFIAGILTVVGYSINDTIVIFDRIRENTRFYKRKEQEKLIDDSINQTLSRSIMTSLTTIIVMIPLFILVSTELREFLIPLMIGVISGTYSSIFLCSPLYYEMTKKGSKSRYVQDKEKRDRQKEKDRARAKARRENEGIVK